MNHSTDEEITPVGGTMKPAIPKTIAKITSTMDNTCFIFCPDVMTNDLLLRGLLLLLLLLRSGKLNLLILHRYRQANQ